MEKYRNFVKIEEIRELLRQGRNEEALELTDGMTASKIKDNYDCSVLAQVYLHNGMLSKAKECFELMYGRKKTRRVAMELVNLSIRLKQADEAETYFGEYRELAPKDYYNLIFRYKIDRLKNKPLEELAKSLEELRQIEFFDNWGYELAKVYHKMGNEEKCLEICDEVILWFGDGEYVERARALKAYYAGELTLKQMSEKTKAGTEIAMTAEPSSDIVVTKPEMKQRKYVQDASSENMGETRVAPGGWITKEALEEAEAVKKREKQDNSASDEVNLSDTPDNADAEPAESLPDEPINTADAEPAESLPDEPISTADVEPAESLPEEPVNTAEVEAESAESLTADPVNTAEVESAESLPAEPISTADAEPNGKTQAENEASSDSVWDGNTEFIIGGAEGMQSVPEDDIEAEIVKAVEAALAEDGIITTLERSSGAEPVIQEKRVIGQEASQEKQEPVQEKQESVQEKQEAVQEKRESVQEKQEPVQKKQEPVQEKREPVQEKWESVQKKQEAVQEKRESAQEKQDIPMREDEKDKNRDTLKRPNEALMAAVEEELGFVEDAVKESAEKKGWKQRRKEKKQERKLREEQAETEKKRLEEEAEQERKQHEAESENEKRRLREEAEAEKKEEERREELRRAKQQAADEAARRAREKMAKETDGAADIHTPMKLKLWDIPASGFVRNILEATSTTLEDYFGFFAFRPEICSLLVKNLEILLNPSVRNMSYCIIGEKGNGKKILIQGITKLLYASERLEAKQAVWTDASKFNGAELAVRAEKLFGRCIVIERAGSLTRASADELLAANEKFANKTSIVLTDYRKNITELFRNSELSTMFPIRLHLPLVNKDDLVALAEYKASKADYVYSEEAYRLLEKRMTGISRATEEGALARAEKYIMKVLDNVDRRNAEAFLKQTLEGREHIRLNVIETVDFPEDI